MGDLRALIAAAATGTKRRPFEYAPPPPTDGQLDAWVAFLADPEPSVDTAEASGWDWGCGLWQVDWSDAFQPLICGAELTLPRFARLTALLRLFRKRDGRYFFQIERVLSFAAQFRRMRRLDFGLAELAQELAFAVPSRDLGWAFIEGWSRPTGWKPEELASFSRDHVDLLEIGIGIRPLPAGVESFRMKESAAKTLVLIRAMDPIPPQLVPRLWEMALGGPQDERALAQACLDRTPATGARLLEELGGKQSVREIAAEWLAARRERGAVPALMTALRHEKTPRGKAALMAALERLGAPVDGFLDRPGLSKEAAKGLAKGIPAALAWFPFEELPDVRWADDGQPVDRAIVRWWIVQAHALGGPEANPLVRRYGTRMVRAEAQALGFFVFDRWVAQDLRMENEQVVGSAIGQKGVLAIAAALGGPEVAPLAEEYIRKLYGNRAAQCKAILAMLSWVDDRAAVQVLLAIATRFRTAGIRKVAEQVVNELAERRAWTVHELADRTIPAVVVDGSKGSQKAIKTLEKRQRERLYLAMCVQRKWVSADWREYLLGHPVVAPLCARIVWFVEGGPTFRPLGDGTFTGPDDAAVMPAPDASIGIAHPLDVPEAELDRWRRHLADHEVEPLFVQWGRSPYRVTAERRDETEIADFRGHMLGGFALKNRATKLGWARGPNVDGHVFTTYRRAVPGLDLVPEIEFSGNSVPEANVPVALIALRFCRGVPGSDVPAPVTLESVPAVLVSECFNDLRDIAEQGTGFDAAWKEKVP